MDSVESICNFLARFKLVEGDAVRTLRARWREQAGAKADQVAEFKRWLTKNSPITDFQLDMLARGHGDQLYFDDYKLLDRIGRGRMAGVYRAVHPLGQQVAIKVLPPSRIKHPQLLGRFLREARLAVRLDHDNVVRTFHHSLTKEQVHYIVMEYLDGETLEDTIERRRRLPVAEVVPLMIQAMQGLDHLDEKGLVHRDLKPANLMLVPPRAAGEPDTTFKATLKILDIGLSRALFDEGDPDGGEPAELTREGAILGTMNYMAPEQARDAHSADIRADIYSLGCVLYEMLSGTPPFKDTKLVRQMRRHAEESARSLMDQVPGISEELEAIVQKMLAKDPALRYLTPGQVIKDLRNLHIQAAAAAKPSRPLRSFLTWVETKRGEDPEPPAKPATSVAAVPIPLPVPIPVPELKKTVEMPAFVAPAPATSIAPPTPKPTSVAAPSKAAPTSVAPIPIPAAQTSVASGLPVTSIAPAAPPKGPTVVATPDPSWQGKLRRAKNAVTGMNRREWICFAAGAGTLVVLQMLYWILRRILG